MAANNPLISNIVIDSRKMVPLKESLFVALVGIRNDGHNYIVEMLSKGIDNFIVSSEKPIELYGQEGNFILVRDTTAALQTIAQECRSKLTREVIGITGSNGKTIVKEWLAQALSKRFLVDKSPKSYNSQIGVPLSLWLLNTKCDWALLEAGISKPDEMEKLEKMIVPSHGIITNIGEAHQENFQSLDKKLLEKLKLFKNAKKIYYCKDHALIHQEILKDEQLAKKELISWSTKEDDCSCRFSSISVQGKQTEAKVISQHADFTVRLNYTDEASIENTFQVINFMLDQEFRPEEIKEIVLQLHPVEMRMEQINGISGNILLNDTYNSDINSLRIALDQLNHIHKKKKVLIISDIQQSGLEARALYQQLSELAQEAKINTLIGVGAEICQHASFFDSFENSFFPTSNDLLSQIQTLKLRDAAILIKGAREFKLEEVASVLSEKTHTTRLEINLNRIVHNLNYFKSCLNPGTKLMVMAKALSYGSGSEIAWSLNHENVDYFGVAFVDEGVKLREFGIKVPIMVMSPSPESFENIIEYSLEPELYNFHTLKKFNEQLKLSSIKNFPVHLKLDTGMHRLGFMNEDLEGLIEFLLQTKHIEVKAIFSHLAASDTAVQDDFTLQQIEKFELMYAKISTALHCKPMKHILNSAGILRFPKAHYDMVRLGIGLHGVSKETDNLLAASTLKTHIIQIKNVQAGETVGYNRSGRINKQTKIATLPIGYADGLDRRFGNKTGHVYVAGAKAPFIGDICMDLCMVDITGIEAKEGDEVIVFGEQNPIEDLAQNIGTIPYEILTNVSERVKRIFINE